MRTISFFNEKGGVGKTLHSIMFASYLSYECGAKVLVIDFENPIPRISKIREEEVKMLDDPNKPLSRYYHSHEKPSEFYRIYSPLDNIEYSYTKENAKDLREAIWSLIRTSVFDYIIFDFPGLLIANSPSYDSCLSGQVDLVAVPFDTEPMTRRSAMSTCLFLQDCKTDVVAFWNNVSSAEISRKGYLEVGEIIFNRRNIPVMPARIKSFAKARRDTTTNLFVRSTVCWPERYVQMACPELKELYKSLKERLDSLPDTRMK